MKNTATITKYILFCYEITLLKWISTYSSQQWTTLDRGDISWCHPLKLLYYVIQSNFSIFPRWYHLSKGGNTPQYGKKRMSWRPLRHANTPPPRWCHLLERNDVHPWELWRHDCFCQIPVLLITSFVFCRASENIFKLWLNQVSKIYVRNEMKSLRKLKAPNKILFASIVRLNYNRTNKNAPKFYN